jgi:hypothetical protein
LKSIKLLIAFTFIITINSCGHYPCGSASSIITLVNFSDAESDTIILLRFDKGSNLTRLHDSLVITSLNSNFVRQHDTVMVLHPINEDFGSITSDYDYKVYFPGINLSYKITSIIEEIHYGSKVGQKVYCLNPITSYSLNGQLINGEKNYDRIYLNK